MGSQEYYSRIREREPFITSRLSRMGRSFGVSMAGLENRFKTYESLNRKLDTRDIRDVNDVLRYTYILPNREYTDLVQSISESLESAGFHINNVKNFWSGINGTDCPVYGGIHLQLSDQSGNKFEIQFHTAKSYQVKEKTHELYKLAKSPDCTKTEKEDLYRQMGEMFKSVRVPRGAADLRINIGRYSFASDIENMLNSSKDAVLHTSRNNREKDFVH